MKLERKHAWAVLALALWNFFIWGTFAKNLSAAHASGEDRPTGYWVAHTVLIVVNTLIGIALAVFGVRAWKATRSDT